MKFYYLLFSMYLTLMGCKGGNDDSNDNSATQTSTQDITNAKFSGTSTDCADYVGNYTANVSDINNNTSITATLVITSSDNTCAFTTNSVPNHDFNDGTQNFPNTVQSVSETFTIPRNPTISQSATTVDIGGYDNAIFLNGAKLDLLSAGCSGVGDGKIGCGYNQAVPSGYTTLWRYDPMHTANNFRVDQSNAHAQPDGAYHYHGAPNKIYDNNQFVVIGFAADGAPIMAPYLMSTNAVPKSSYRLKSGTRSDAGAVGSDGTLNYNGTFIQDYEYAAGLGDLDECNGAVVDGVYRYFVTPLEYPWILKCFKGTPNDSFSKGS